MSETALHLRRLEARSPAAYAVARARIQALEAQGWTFREVADGYVAELGNRRGVFASTMKELLTRINPNEGAKR